MEFTSETGSSAGYKSYLSKGSMAVSRTRYNSEGESETEKRTTIEGSIF